jgi:hypothetical protein
MYLEIFQKGNIFRINFFEYKADYQCSILYVIACMVYGSNSDGDKTCKGL